MSWRATVLALASALLGAGASHSYLAGGEQLLLDGAPVSVVMVTRDVAVGEVISRGAIDIRELPERYLEDRHILAADLDRLVGARATAAVASGSSLLWSDLDASQEPRALSSLVRSGMRAFALPERDVSFAGLLRPGDRVDVLFTPTATSSGSITLLQRVLVLTVGSDLGEPATSTDSRDGESGRVTLSVTLEQAQRLAYSEGRGRLRLALRNAQDVAVGDELPSSFGAPPASAVELSRGKP